MQRIWHHAQVFTPPSGRAKRNATISAEGRLFSRPLEPLVSELSAHGMSFSWQDEKILEVSSKLIGGLFKLPGDISSQFISGLLLSLPLLNESSTIQITGSIQSKDYLAITEQVMQ
ncbi:MAG: 3-phosphoshikimate 1-carboxyvinyltransferase, partial [Atopobium sp.]|nr:3-phosphoshikimate 1-carboxyvinyltransferase [Atopobium sp.]